MPLPLPPPKPPKTGDPPPPPPPPSPKRLVLFVGPHKSASTSIQNFFIEHAANIGGGGVSSNTNSTNSNSNSSTRGHHHPHPSFVNWTWPYAPMATHPAAYSDLVKHYPRQEQQWHDSRRAELYYTMSFVWDNYKNNVVFGDEEFDRMGETVHTHRNGLQPLKNIVQLLQPPRLDIVVNYRTPRHEHWLSIWKQLSGGSSPYRGFVCQGTKPWEHLETQGNPLAIVHELLGSLGGNVNVNDNWNVTLIDMGGVQRDGLDISHVVACEVLGVPCDDNGWVQGLEHTSMHANNRSGDPGLTNVQLDELEWILRQRDCSYMTELLEHNINNNNKQQQQQQQLTVLHQDTLWQDCDKFESSFQRSLRNTTFLLQLIQSQVDCGRHATDNSTTSQQQAVVRRSSISKLMESSSKKVPIHHSEKKVVVLEPPSFLRDARRQSVPVTPPDHKGPLQLLLSTKSSLDADLSLMKDLKGFVLVQHCLVILMLLLTLKKLYEMLRRRLPKKGFGILLTMTIIIIIIILIIQSGIWPHEMRG